MKNNSFLTSLSMGLIRDVQSLMAGNSSVESPLEQLGEAAKVLTDKQKKIDKNHNGKLDAEDFAKLRKEGIDRVIITSPHTPDIHGGLAEVTHRDIRTGVVTVMFENMYYKLKKGQFNELPESFEQLDELSKATLGSYVKKAANSMAQSHAEVEKARADYNSASAIDHATSGTPSDVRQKAKDIIRNDAMDRESAARKTVGKRYTGIGKATDKLTKEEVELVELSKKTVQAYVKKSQNSEIKADNQLRDNQKTRDTKVSAISSATKMAHKATTQKDHESALRQLSYANKRKSEPDNDSLLRKVIAKRQTGQELAYNNYKEETELEETFELYDLTELNEGAGSLKGLPKHMISSIVTKVHGGENSPVEDHGKSPNHSHLRTTLSKAMSSGKVAVVHVNGKPVSAVHISSDDARPKYGVGDETSNRSITRTQQMHNTGKYDRRQGKYIAPKYSEYQSPHHSKEEALHRVMGTIEKHTGDLTDKGTYKKHNIEIKTYGRDANRAKVHSDRIANKPKMQANYVNYAAGEHRPMYTDKKTTSRTPAGDMSGIKSKALDKMADKHVVDSSSPKTKATELHAALGKAIAAGDTKQAKAHMDELDRHVRQSGLDATSPTRTRYKDAVKDLRDKGGYSKDYSREKLKDMKASGKIKEEVEELDELSKGTLAKYIPTAAKDLEQATHDQEYYGHDQDFRRGKNRLKGIGVAVKKLAKEEVELTQEEIDNIEASLADLDEGRGRPPKEGSEAWKRRQMQAAEDVPALGIQLRKAASINKPVIFANGESKQIHPNHINRFNDHMDARKTSQEKADFQKTANKSHADFVKSVTADVPHRGKDTGEIVKYGK